MFRTVLVPLDGSARAECALPYAIRFAQERGGRLVLVQAALAPPPAGLDWTVGLDWDDQQQVAMDEITTYLTGVAERVSTQVPVLTAPLYGQAVDEILAALQEFDADSIIMATHGRTGPAHLLYGSVAEAVLARSPVPVFVACDHPGHAPAAFDLASARIIVPLDGSVLAEAALPAALDIVGAAGELVLLTVATPPDHVERDITGHVRAYLDQQEEATTRAAFDYLRGIQAQLAHQRTDLRVTIDVPIGNPAASIVAAETAHAADLVVMATHGRTGLRRAVYGSVAGAVLSNGRAPVLLVSPVVSAILDDSSPRALVGTAPEHV